MNEVLLLVTQLGVLHGPQGSHTEWGGGLLLVHCTTAGALLAADLLASFLAHLPACLTLLPARSAARGRLPAGGGPAGGCRRRHGGLALCQAHAAPQPHRQAAGDKGGGAKYEWLDARVWQCTLRKAVQHMPARLHTSEGTAAAALATHQSTCRPTHMPARLPLVSLAARQCISAGRAERLWRRGPEPADQPVGHHFWAGPVLPHKGCAAHAVVAPMARSGAPCPGWHASIHQSSN